MNKIQKFGLYTILIISTIIIIFSISSIEEMKKINNKYIKDKKIEELNCEKVKYLIKDGIIKAEEEKNAIIKSSYSTQTLTNIEYYKTFCNDSIIE
jgi:hypothetical protein